MISINCRQYKPGNRPVVGRVILPITDPYVVHHGALGSYATVYVAAYNISRAAELLSKVPGVESVLPRQEAVEQIQLPAEQIGDLIVLSVTRRRCWGARRIGMICRWSRWGYVRMGPGHESIVPMIVNQPLIPAYAKQLDSGEVRNFDLFDFLCNGVID